MTKPPCDARITLSTWDRGQVCTEVKWSPRARWPSCCGIRNRSPADACGRIGGFPHGATDGRSVMSKVQSPKSKVGGRESEVQSPKSKVRNVRVGRDCLPRRLKWSAG